MFVRGYVDEANGILYNDDTLRALLQKKNIKKQKQTNKKMKRGAIELLNKMDTKLVKQGT